MSITPLRFSGISTYSQDFQTIVDRAVAIANLPVKAIQQDQTRMLSEKAAMGGLNSAVASLASDLLKLGETSSGGAISVSSSSSRLSVSAETGAAPGTWQVDSIESIAEATIATSTSGYGSATTTAIAGAGNFLQLTVGGTSHDIQLGSGEDNLTAIRDKINALGAGVTASILYSGGSDPKHYLTLTATETGAQAVTLETRAVSTPETPGTQLMAATKPGTDAIVWINGVKVQRSSNTIDDAIEGLDLTVREKTSGEKITVSSALDRGTLKEDLAGFANSFNALIAKIDEQMGDSAGMLSGNSLIRQIRSQLSGLSSFERSGAVPNLAGLGLEFDKSGVLSLNESVIDGMGSASLDQALDFLNSADGLAGMASGFTAFSDLTDGLIQQQIDEFDTADARMSKQVEEMTLRINDMQTSLLAKLQQADAMLAMLDSQRNMLDASISSLNLVLYGKKDS